MSAWSEPIILTPRLASELGARLSQLGVEPRLKYHGPGKIALSVAIGNLPVLQEAVESINISGSEPSASLNQGIQQKRAHLDAWQVAQVALSEGDTGRILPAWKNVLDEAQKTAVNAMLEPGLLGFCLFDEQGTGKTFMALGLMHHLIESSRITQVIIFCPSSMLGEWESKLQNLPCLSPHIKGRSLVLSAGANLLSIPKSVKALVMNYRQAVSRQTQLMSWASKLKATGEQERTLVIFDESFIVKNEDAQASLACMEIRKQCTFGLILCGTPAPNKPKDVIHQVNLSDLGAALGAFRETGDQDQDLLRLSHLIEDRAAFLRRLKKDVLSSLPEKVFSVKRLKMSPKHKALYEEARSAYRSRLISLGGEGIKKAYTDVLSTRARLIQLCSYPSSNELPDSDNTKYAALGDLLSEICLKGKRKVVIWTSYLDSLSRTSSFVNSVGLTSEEIHGDIPPEHRTEIINRFQLTESPSVLICNPAAAGAGITLTAAADAIYMSYPSQAAHFLQSIDRIHRRGQKAEEIKFHFLVFGETIEDRELARLFRKEESQAELLGDIYELPRTIEDFLAEIDG